MQFATVCPQYTDANNYATFRCMICDFTGLASLQNETNTKILTVEKRSSASNVHLGWYMYAGIIRYIFGSHILRLCLGAQTVLRISDDIPREKKRF